MNPSTSASSQAPQSLAPAALAPGAAVGRFQVQALLGSGGMGAVYLAWDPVLERKVALKAIRLGADAKGAALRFRREAMALAQLNHRHVCQVHDWVEARGSAFIAMEFVEGETLATAGPGMPFRQKLQALRSIAFALEAAHAKGIVHRDLKPSNVMVDAAGQVKVLDFGLARLVTAGGRALRAGGGEAPLPAGFPEEAGSEATQVDSGAGGGREDTLAAPGASPLPADSWGEMTEAGLFMGSPVYASPEQMAGGPAGPPSDVFSLGVVAWELLLGDHPFPGEGRARMAATRQGELRSLRGRGLPRQVAGLLRAMLQLDPAARPTARQVAERLGRLLAGTPAAWWVGGSLAALGLLLGPAYYLFGRGVIADLGRERPPRTVVLPVRNDTGDPSVEAQVAVGMTELLSSALQGSPRLAVVDPESVGRAMANLRLSPAEAADSASHPRIANALGAQLFLRGTLSRDPAGGADLLSYALVDQAGRVRFSGLARAPRQASFVPYALVDPAVHDLLRKVDPLRSGAMQAAPVPAAVFAAYAEGKARFLRGDFKGAEPFLREAAHQAPAFSGAVSAYAACLRRLGRDQAHAVANWALMSARATGDRWAEGRALALKAYLAKDQGNLDDSQKLREATLVLAQSIGDRDAELGAINHLGLLAAERGQAEAAGAFYDRAIRLSQQTGDQVYLSLAQNNRANLALKRGDLAAAEALYRTNLDLQRSLGNRWGEALALNNLGVLALMARDLPAAGERLGAVLAIREAVGDRVGQATCLRNLGILALMKGDRPASAAFHARALALAQAAGMRTVEAECRFYGAELERLEGRYARALAGYEKVLELLPPGVTPEVRANAQAGAAECLARRPRPALKEAGERLQALAGPGADSPYAHRARAWVAFASGRPEAAAAALALAAADPNRQAPEIHAELEAAREAFARR